jgi:hypothetical protein
MSSKRRAGTHLSVLIALGLSISAPAMGAEILNFPAPQPKSQSKPQPKLKPAPAVMPAPAPTPAPAQQPLHPAGIASDCKEWTDNCRVCALDGKGAAACSNVGIACQPEKWRCTRP